MIQHKIDFLKSPVTGRSPGKEFFYLTNRNCCFSGGYGSTKTTVACQKAVLLLATFPGYRFTIIRKRANDLSRTTRSTFFKPYVCPPEFYDEKKGGHRADSVNYLKFINGSEVFWLNLDAYDQKTTAGFETNSVFIDQAEEIDEEIYIHLSGRVGRWDGAKIPETMDAKNFPINPISGNPVPPSYMLIACNPDSELHWIYKYFHPDSEEWQKRYKDTNSMVQASTLDNPALPPEIIQDYLKRDEAFKRRFVYGIWGIPEGAIHDVFPESILETDDNFKELPGKNYIDSDFINTIVTKGACYRILDHGEAQTPTCMLWVTSYKDWHFVYREYYKEGLISEHRENIHFLSQRLDGGVEYYVGNWADPQIFKKTSQKYGGVWSVADEYIDIKISENPPPGLNFSPAENNEFFTRNRLSELLKKDKNIRHPITSEFNSPRLYFIKQSKNYLNGCHNVIIETKSQKRRQVDSINGKPIFSEERSEKISDHSYDALRYYVAMRPNSPGNKPQRAPKGSWYDIRNGAIGNRINYGDNPAGTPEFMTF